MQPSYTNKTPSGTFSGGINLCLSALDIEIQEMEAQLEPGTKNYRYNAMCLDILRLQRDIIEYQEQAKNFEAEAASNRLRMEALELKTAILERTLTLLCKPENRTMLAAQVADSVLQKWQASVEKRLP